MIEAVVKGIIMGLMVSFSLGPVFFILLESSLHHRFVKPFLFSLGVMVSDIVIVVVLFKSTSGWFTQVAHYSWVRYAGGSVLILFGLTYILSRLNIPITQDPGSFFLKGIVVNTINPGVPLFWLPLITLIHTEFPENPTSIHGFFIALFVVVFIMNIVKILLSKRIPLLFKPRILTMMKMITGLILICFGTFIILNPVNDLV